MSPAGNKTSPAAVLRAARQILSNLNVTGILLTIFFLPNSITINFRNTTFKIAVILLLYLIVIHTSAESSKK